MFDANFAPLVIGVLLFLFGPVAPKILERLLGNAPSRLWRFLAFLCVLAGWTIVLLNEPAITQVKLHPKLAIGSTVAVIGVSLLLVRSKLFDSPSDRVRLSGRIICREAALVLNAKEKFYDCFFVMQLKVTNDGLPTMVSRWQLDLYWEGVEYPSVRQSIAGYHVKVPSSHANGSEINFEMRPLTEFPNNEEITTANYKIGWVRCKVGALPANAVGNFQRLRREVVLKLQAFDSKDRPHLIYEGSIEDLSGCGTIERPEALNSQPRLADTSDKLQLIKTLGIFRDEGNDLLQRLSIHRVLVPYEQDFERWRKKVQDYLEQTSQGYAVRFRSKNIEYQCPLKASQRTRPLIDMAYTCVMRLEEFIRELSS